MGAQMRDLNDSKAPPKMFQELQESVDNLQTQLIELRTTFAKDQQQVTQEFETTARELIDAGVARFGDSFNARVEASMATANLVDGMIRKEIDDRLLDSRRLWGAIENHTHDLDLSTMRTEQDSPAPANAGAMSAARAGLLSAAPTVASVQTAAIARTHE